MIFSKDPTLLRSIIMSHYENPNKKINDVSKYKFDSSYQNKSSSCIDDITAYVKIENDVISNIYFSGLGCAISTSSTNIMCNHLIGKSIDNAYMIIENYLNMTLGKSYDEEILGELIALYNIHNQSNRIKCAQIGVNAIYESLKQLKNEK